MSDRSKSRSRSRSRSRSKSRDKTEEGSGDEEIYEVEEIRDKRRGDDGDWLYYVKWVSSWYSLLISLSFKLIEKPPPQKKNKKKTGFFGKAFPNLGGWGS